MSSTRKLTEISEKNYNSTVNTCTVERYMRQRCRNGVVPHVALSTWR